MRKGYLTGRLDFKYKNPLSEVREQHILNAVETEMLLSVTRDRLMIDAALSAALLGKSKQATSLIETSYKTYLELALPYIGKNTKLDSNAISKEELKEWSAFLTEKNKLLAKSK